MGGKSALARVRASEMATDVRLHSILLVTFTSVFGNHAVPVALPAISRELAVSDARIGLIMTAFFVPSALAMVPIGSVADIYGRRAVVLPALLVFGVAGTAVFFVDSFRAVLALRVVQGAVFPALTPLATALVGDLYTGARGATAQGVKSSTNAAAALLAPAIAGVLVGLGWQYPFLLSLLAFPTLLLAYRYLPETAPATTSPSASALRSNVRRHLRATRAELGDVSLRALLVVAFLGFAIKYGVLTFVPLLAARELGASGAVVGVLLAVRSGVRIPVSPQSGLLARRLPYRYALVLTLGIVGATAVLMPSMPTVLALGVLLGAYAVGDGLFNPLLNDAIVTIADDERRSTVVTAAGVFKDGANALAPAVLGLVLAGFGFDAVFWLIGVTALVAGVVVLAFFEADQVGS